MGLAHRPYLTSLPLPHISGHDLFWSYRPGAWASPPTLPLPDSFRKLSTSREYFHLLLGIDTVSLCLLTGYVIPRFPVIVPVLSSDEPLHLALRYVTFT